MKVIADTEAMRFVLQHHGTYACYLGAGASAEAGVKTAFSICEEIREAVQPKDLSGPALAEWLNSHLNWDDLALRYATCMQTYGGQASRLRYFRQLLVGKKPSFCHHAVAMLAAGGYFKKTILTTNFDKLLENAFARQGRMECQPIRTNQELKYWVKEDDKAYVIKLHGDYDTSNIANTLDQVFMISDPMQNALSDLLRGGGLVVLGAAGQEKSVHTLLDRLSEKAGPTDHVLDFGLLWGVYMGARRPAKFDEREVLKRVKENVGRDIIQLMDRMSLKNEMFAFFPVWGAGNFFLELTRRIKDKQLVARAQSYMDHEMRLRQVFTLAGLKPKAIDQHLERLRKQRAEVDAVAAPTMQAEVVYNAKRRGRPLHVQILYGDITSRSMLSSPAVGAVRRAVVSPEDTCISAGGGVAYKLLHKAGDYILNDLAKLQPIEHTSVATTAGGDLPVHYIFHAAALRIDESGNYIVNQANVSATVTAVLQLSQALAIGALWIPLIGAGTAGLEAATSLRSILECVREWRPPHPATVHIVIYSDSILTRTIAQRLARQVLGKMYTAV